MRSYKYNFTSRKFYIFVLTIMICLVGSLSIAYAILSTSLSISGTSDIVASNWNIYISSYLEVDSGSVTDELPVINSKRNHLDFSAKLEEPGDYYRFVFRVKNKGTIDAMIDSIVKTPELTAEQAKYLSYNIEYEDGTSINEKHFLAREEGQVNIAVTVAFRTDIEISDLPTEDIDLNLGLTMVYVQADNSNVIPTYNTERKITVYSFVYDSFGERTHMTDDSIILLDMDTYETHDCTITGEDYYCVFDKLYAGRTYKVSLAKNPGYIMNKATLRDSENNYNSIFDGNGYITIPADYNMDDNYAKFYFDTMVPAESSTYRITIYVREADDTLVKVDNSSATVVNLLTGDSKTKDLTIDEDGLYIYSISEIMTGVPYEVSLNLGETSFTIDKVMAKAGTGEYLDVNYNGNANQFIIPSTIRDSTNLNVRVYVTLN